MGTPEHNAGLRIIPPAGQGTGCLHTNCHPSSEEGHLHVLIPSSLPGERKQSTVFEVPENTLGHKEAGG